MVTKMGNIALYKIFISALVILGLLSNWAFAEETNCGLDNIKVEFTSQNDAIIACEGIRRALSFFEFYGYRASQLIHIKMLDQVISESVAEYKGDKELKLYCANFSGENGHSKITSWKTSQIQNRKIFGSISDTPELHISIVAHEVAHDLYSQIYKYMGKEVERPLTEFVSYVVQIETMRNEEKTKVMGLWPDKKFETAYEINTLTWASAPNMFGIMSYRYHHENPDFIKSIFKGEVRSGDDLLLFR